MWIGIQPFILTQQLNSQWLPAITTIIAHRQHLFQIEEHSLKFSLNAYYWLEVDILGAVAVPVALCCWVESLYKAEADEKMKPYFAERFCCHHAIQDTIFFGNFIREIFSDSYPMTMFLATIIPLKMTLQKSLLKGLFIFV